VKDNSSEREGGILATVIKQRGFFWWLNEPRGGTNSKETSVPGLLTISEEGHIKLDLDGILWHKDPSKVHWGPQIVEHGKFITGRLNEHGDGNYCVLLHKLLRTNFPLISSAQAPTPESYEAKLCLTTNSPYSADFAFDGFHQVRIDLTGLEDWLSLDSILHRIETYNDGDVEVRVSYKDREFSFVSEDGIIAIESQTLGAAVFNLHPQVPDRTLSFEQGFYLTYTPASNAGVDSLLQNFLRVEELFSLLLGAYFRLDWPTIVHRGDPFDSWHRVYSYRGTVPDFKPSRYQMWTNFHMLRETFGGLFFAWKAQFADLGEPYYLYMAELRHPLPYAEHKLVNLLWVFESLHRKQKSKTFGTPSATERTARIESILKRLSEPGDERDKEWFEDRVGGYQKDPRLPDRIFDCLSKLPVAFDEAALWTFSYRCARCRNDISHGKFPANESPTSLAHLADAASLLYHALLLREIGLGSEHLRKALTEGGLAEFRILPALNSVGLNIAKAQE
jgi:ApeA N-terminal domain 1